MEIRTIPVSDIKPALYNPRVDLRPGDLAYERLKESINTFGYVEPMVWNELTGNLIGGHQRLKVLIEQGATDIEVSVVNLSLEKGKILNLILNKVQGAWNDTKLAVLIEELGRIPDFDITITGFNPPEISHLMDTFKESLVDAFDFEGAVGAIEEPITKKGDVIQLNSHRIMCGDSESEKDLDKLMQNEKIDLIHMDPPYGCLYLSQNRPDLQAKSKKSKRWEKLYKDDLNEKEYEEWIKSVLKNISRFMKNGASAYIWNGHAKFYFVHQVLKELGFHISTVITWAKPTFAISYGEFNQQTEFCIFSWLKNGPHKWYGPTNETNLWEIARDKVSDLIHPTQKSMQIPARAIRNSSIRGDIIFDGFLGSGSSVLASESLGRRCFGIEIEPKYVDGIIKRYVAYVGKDKISDEIKAKYLKEA